MIPKNGICAVLLGAFLVAAFHPIIGAHADIRAILEKAAARTSQDNISQPTQAVGPAISSRDQALRNPAATLNVSLYPSVVPSAGGARVQLNHSSNSVSISGVNIGGKPCKDLRTVGARSVSCVVPEGSNGPADVMILSKSGSQFKANARLTYSTKLVITSVAPDTSALSGGGSISIVGRGFTKGSSVVIGTSACGRVKFINSKKLTCVIPSRTEAGTVSIRVVAANGSSVKRANAFTYLDEGRVSVPKPVVASVYPASGSVAGGLSVTLLGTGFSSGMKVFFGGAECTPIVVSSSGMLSCKTPPGTVGPVPVSVTSVAGESSYLLNAFSYESEPSSLSATITAVSPSSGPTAGGSTVEISGTNFVNGVTVKVGGAACTSVNFISSSSLTCRVPAGSVGPVDVVATNPDGKSATRINGFTYWSNLAPVLSSVFPNYGAVVGGTVATVKGANFVAGALVQIGGIDCASSTFVDSSTLTCVTPAFSYGQKSVVVINADGQATVPPSTLTPATSFTYGATQASVASVSPNYGPIAGGTTVTINGSNFLSGATAYIGGVACATTSFVNFSTLTCVTPASSYGTKSVEVYNADGVVSTTLVGGFSYSGGTPAISAVSPITGPISGGTTITVLGSNFTQGTIIQVGGINCVTTFISSSSLSCVTPPNSVGAKNVSVVPPDGSKSVTLGSAFTYGSLTPILTAVSPNYGPLAGGTTISIGGSNFTPTSVVQIGGIDCTTSTFISSTNMTCVTPSGASYGAKTVQVINADGVVSSAFVSGFTYGVGAISVATVSPIYGPVAGGTTITVLGSNFSQGAVIQVGGISCTTTFISSSSLSCVTPANSVGAKSVAVVPPDGAATATLTNAFTYGSLTPTIISTSPNFGPLAGGTTITVAGTNFTATSVVQVGGINCSTTTYVNPSSITCITPASPSYGAKSVQVLNADGTASSAFASGFTYNYGFTPTIQNVYPNAGPSSGGQIIYLVGSNFMSGAVVSISQASAGPYYTCDNVTVLSPNVIKCTTPPGDVGAKFVRVVNSDGGANTPAASYTYFTTNTYDSAQVGLTDSATLGRALVSADYTGDGINDLVVGAPGATTTSMPTVANAGVVYIYNGATKALFCTIEAPSPQAGASFGAALATGNLSGGSHPELVVGEPSATVNSLAQAGRAYVYRGADIRTCLGGFVNTAMSTLTAAVAQQQAGAKFGYSLATGNINAGTVADIIVGAPYYDSAASGAQQGAIHIYTGSYDASNPVTLSPMFTSGSWNDNGMRQATTPTSFASYGFALATVDFDNDGRVEIAVGEPGTTNGGVHVYQNTDGSSAVFSVTNPSLTCTASTGRCGYALANGGKINGDARDDLLVGEPWVSTGAGKVFAYYLATGTANGATAATSSNFTPALPTTSVENYSNFGMAVARLGDLDGDGREEFIVGQPNASSGNWRGRVHVMNPYTTLIQMTITGAENNAKLGRAVCGMGDLNSDGSNDFAFSEPNGSVGGPNRGRVFTYLAP